VIYYPQYDHTHQYYCFNNLIISKVLTFSTCSSTGMGDNLPHSEHWLWLICSSVELCKLWNNEYTWVHVLIAIIAVTDFNSDSVKITARKHNVKSLFKLALDVQHVFFMRLNFRFAHTVLIWVYGTNISLLLKRSQSVWCILGFWGFRSDGFKHHHSQVGKVTSCRLDSKDFNFWLILKLFFTLCQYQLWSS
jgi:hypothetical protein